MRTLCVITGHGGPDYESKKRGCVGNIKKIKETAGDVDFIVCVYDTKCDLRPYRSMENCTIIHEPNIVGQYIYKYVTPHSVRNYDRLLLLLDDITLPSDYDIEKLSKIQSENNLDILSPCLTLESEFTHQFMRENDKKYKGKLRRVTFLEYFCYMFDLTKPASYQKYYELFEENPETRWMWGLDYLLYKEKSLRAGIVNDFKIHHAHVGSGRGGKYTGGREIGHLCRKYKYKVHGRDLHRDIELSDI